jgi:predicted acyl esterase
MRRRNCSSSGDITRPIELTGHAQAELLVRVAGDDAALFLYLDALDPAGRGYYLTEDLLRLHHRSDDGHPSFTRPDARPLAPGERTKIVIRMLPTSVRLPSGWRIRLSLAAADADTFEPIPDAQATTRVTVEWGRRAPPRCCCR